MFQMQELDKTPGKELSEVERDTTQGIFLTQGSNPGLLYYR